MNLPVFQHMDAIGKLRVYVPNANLNDKYLRNIYAAARVYGTYHHMHTKMQRYAVNKS